MDGKEEPRTDCEREPIAVFETISTTWELTEVVERDVELVTGTDEEGEPETTITTKYRCRVSTPITRDQGQSAWESGTVSRQQLNQAGAVRTDGGEGWP